MKYLTLILSVLIATPAVSTAAPWKIVDDFKSRKLDHSVWQTRGPNNLTLEMQRKLRRGALQLRTRAYSDSGNNDGYIASNYSVFLANSIATKVTQLQARIRITNSLAAFCLRDFNRGWVRFRMRGNLLSDGTNAGNPASFEGNIYFILGVNKIPGDRLPDDTYAISYFTAKCTDADCSTSKTIANGALGTVRKNKWIDLSVQNRAAKHQLVFKAGRTSKTVNYRRFAARPVAAPTPFLGLQNRADVPNCTTSGNLRPFVDMTTQVDRVRVNRSALSQ